MLKKLTRIDELTRPDHYHLEADDDCAYFGEYTARQGPSYSPCNNLVLNFKHDVKWKGKPPWTHKLRAIESVAQAIVRLAPNAVRHWTFVPVPPSKTRSDPEYDDRCYQTLHRLQSIARHAVDVRELVVQTDGIRAAHESASRPSPEELQAIYQIDEALTTPIPTAIVVFDDLLTTGAHFKAIKAVLRGRFPGVPVLGLFIARRNIPNPFADA